MGKPKTLPLTKAESAERRLEEIVNNKSMIKYTVVFESQSYWYYHPVGGESRLYPDGFEAVVDNNRGILHVERRRLFVDYDLEKEYKKQGKAE